MTGMTVDNYTQGRLLRNELLVLIGRVRAAEADGSDDVLEWLSEMEATISSALSHTAPEWWGTAP